ncbi:MAG: helix-turn-helix domain-containing protein, partial [Bacilli bacterium]
VAVGEEDETPSHLVSFKLYQDGRTIEEIVKLRNLKPMTIQDHIIRSGLEGHEIDWKAIIPEQYETLIISAIEKVGAEKLKPIKEELPEEVDYFAIKAVVGRYKKNF